MAMAGLITFQLSGLVSRLEALMIILVVLFSLGLVTALALVITSRRLANVSLACRGLSNNPNSLP